MSESIKVSDKQGFLLRHAKTKMIMGKTTSVKKALKFSELTPTKQKLVIQDYKKQLKKEKKRAGIISAKGLIGGIGVVKQPERIDTTKGGAGMGKSISITEGKKFRQQFEGGAKITWLEHVKKFREANPEMSYKDALKEAKKTYTPMRSRERVQQKLDTAERKKSFVKKPRKLTKKQVALRFSAYDDPDYDEEFEKVWDKYIKGTRFKDNDELLVEFKKHYSP